MFPFLHTQTVTESQLLHTRPHGGDHPFHPHTSQHWLSSLSDSRCHVSQLMGLCRPISKNWSLFSQPPFLYVLISIEQCHKVLTESEFRKNFFLPFDLFGGGVVSKNITMYFESCLWKYHFVHSGGGISISLSLCLSFVLFFFLVAGLHRTNLYHNWHGHVRRA